MWYKTNYYLLSFEYLNKAGQDAEMAELIDHICAARLEKELHTQFSKPPLDDEITQVKSHS